ncbi:uncharacterized protein LOC123558147 [Mercenaria mercenaria]|uniref:uncharacterized protein LOC123558147 n=1 Tax=Mercenaria mercenaria TaxID=6596 RepID=UPI00234EE4F3|nr:uncharacterized protein LOC123558147 [Mercenaria mercenaria]
MSKLIVDLPAIRRYLRKTKSFYLKLSKNDDALDKKIKNREYVKKFREKLKSDPTRRETNEKYKKQKKEQNLAYKKKTKELRKVNPSYDDHVKEMQRKWKKESRARNKKLAEKEKSPNNTKEQNQNRKRKSVTPVNNPSKKYMYPKTKSSTNKEKREEEKSQSRIRKRAQRIKSPLPESTNYWAKALNHVLNTATPRRKSKLEAFNRTINQDQHDVLRLNKVGRPTKDIQDVKRKLAFAAKSPLSTEKYNLNRYKTRKLKRLQNHNLPKPEEYAQKWKPEI